MTNCTCQYYNDLSRTCFLPSDFYWFVNISSLPLNYYSFISVYNTFMNDQTWLKLNILMPSYYSLVIILFPADMLFSQIHLYQVDK